MPLIGGIEACATALNRNGWLVSLTTSKIEDLIYEHAAVRAEPVLLGLASTAAICKRAKVCG